MDYVYETYEDVLIQVVDLTRATLKEANEFKSTLSKKIEEGYRKIVIDLSHCEFIDSTFLGALVVSLKNVTALGGDLRLVGFHPAVYQMIQQTKMYRVFEIFSTKDAAIKSYNP
ncbi:MAG: STAS domain-containing protein [Ignavibacteriaceae bacterium]|nr:STAS domain-containing protein [Ignavibacteriaceae bacterium]